MFFFFQTPDTPFRASVRFTVHILAPHHHPPVGSRPIDSGSGSLPDNQSLSPSARIHGGTVACNGREIAGPARQSCLVPVIIAAVRSVSRCLLPNNYSSAVLTGGEGGKKKKYVVDCFLAPVSYSEVIQHSTICWLASLHKDSRSQFPKLKEADSET